MRRALIASAALLFTARAPLSAGLSADYSALRVIDWLLPGIPAQVPSAAER